MERLVAYIVAAVIALLALGSVARYASRAYHGGTVTVAITEATDMWHSAQSVYGNTAGGGASNYTNVNNTAAKQAGIVPSQMAIGTGDYITGPWNTSNVVLSGQSYQFSEQWNNVPSTSCAQFALSQPASTVTVNGTTIGLNNDGSASAAVASACSIGQGGSVSTIRFDFTEISGQ